MQSNIPLIDDKITEILLKDRTTGKNIIWAADNYQKYGERYNLESQITLELLTHNRESVIKPRTQKSNIESIKKYIEFLIPLLFGIYAILFILANNKLIENKFFKKCIVYAEESYNMTEDFSRT